MKRFSFLPQRTLVSALQLLVPIVICIVILFCATVHVTAQTLNLITKTTTMQIKTSDIDSLTVQSTTFTIIKKDKTTQVVNIADLLRMTFTLITGVADEKQAAIMGALALIKAYPNPANATSSVEYQLSRPASVEAHIVDATGKLVKTLPMGFQQAGTYQVQWDATSDAGATVANGSYTCIIRTGGEMLTQKLIIIH